MAWRDARRRSRSWLNPGTLPGGTPRTRRSPGSRPARHLARCPAVSPALAVREASSRQASPEPLALAVAAGLGSTAADVCRRAAQPDSALRARDDRRRRHHLMASPRVRSRSPAHRCPGDPRPSATGSRQPAALPDPVSDKTHRGPSSAHGRKGHGAVPGRARAAYPRSARTVAGRWATPTNAAWPSPAPRTEVSPGATQSLRAVRARARIGPHRRSSPFPWPLPLATKGCPAGTTPYQETHASGR